MKSNFSSELTPLLAIFGGGGGGLTSDIKLRSCQRLEKRPSPRQTGAPAPIAADDSGVADRSVRVAVDGDEVAISTSAAGAHQTRPPDENTHLTLHRQKPQNGRVRLGRQSGVVGW